MRVVVKLFAALAQQFGQREVEVDLPDGATAADVRRAVAALRPDQARAVEGAAVAVDHAFADPGEPLRPGAEVALIPPVSGGGSERFRITTEPLALEGPARMVVDPHKGAVVLFCGTVREFTGGRQTVRLDYEAYEEMALRMLRQIAAEIAARWAGTETAIHHRVGTLEISEISVVIAVASPHRADAFEACRYAIERLKQIVPIWKKEVFRDGEVWVGSQTGPWAP